MEKVLTAIFKWDCIGGEKFFKGYGTPEEINQWENNLGVKAGDKKPMTKEAAKKRNYIKL
jgi:hypothetical protein